MIGNGGGEKKSLGMSELGCGDGRGRLRTAWVQRGDWKWRWGEEATGDERAWLRGRLRTAWCKGVAGNWWGVEAAGDERAWLCGRLRTAWCKGMGGGVEVQGSGWKLVGSRSRGG